jgi:site-specific DNA-methyltransferase (adenine-specific)
MLEMLEQMTNRKHAMRQYLGDTLGEGEHVLELFTDVPVFVEIEEYGDGTHDYEVTVSDPSDPEADLPSLEEIIAHVERLSGEISDHLLPEMTEAEYEALKASISRWGVMVPVLRAADGCVIDGRKRLRACRELGVKNCPTTVVGKLTLEEKRELRLDLNLCRRQVGLPVKRQIAETLLRRAAWLSNRCIGRQAGLDHKTVASLRAEFESRWGIPHHDTRIGDDGKKYPSISVHSPKEFVRAGKALQQMGDNGPNRVMDLSRAEYLARKDQMAADREKPIAIPTPGDTIRILHSDFRTMDIQPDTVGMILTDLPYAEKDLPTPSGPWAAESSVLAACWWPSRGSSISIRSLHCWTSTFGFTGNFP